MKPGNQSVLPSLLKAALVVVSVFLVLAVVAGTAGWYWWSKHGKQITRTAVSVQQEGMEAGKQTDERGCLEQSFLRLKEQKDLEGNVKVRIFLAGCLHTAHSTPGFCDGVPPGDQIVESVRWRMDACKERKQTASNDCQALLTIVQAQCGLKANKSSKH